MHRIFENCGMRLPCSMLDPVLSQFSKPTHFAVRKCVQISQICRVVFVFAEFVYGLAK